MIGNENTAPQTVLTIAFPYAPIGPEAVGGAEVICSQLEASLATHGWTSVVVAHEHSHPRGKLYPTHVPEGVITDELRSVVEASQQANIDRALAAQHISLVHMHGLDFHRYRIPHHIPVVVTLHLPPAWYPASIWQLPANYHLVCVSQSQHRSCPAQAKPSLAVIENGVPLPDRATLRAEGRYALMLARICPEKNLHAGFDAARLAGIPAMLGGEVFPYEAHLRYLQDEIRPRLSATGAAHETRHGNASDVASARFLGPVTGDEKQRLLARAACLLLPSLAPETSSLVAMEALAAGIPVVGMATGAVPEIVEHGRTGYLVPPGDDATAGLAEALRKVPQLDRGLCRTTAEQRFPLRRMVEAYVRLYGELALPEVSRHDPEPQKPRPNRLVLEPVSDLNALEALTPEWAALWSTAPRTTPFQHPAWLLPWWRQFGPDGELQAIAVRDETTRQLSAFLPVYVYKPQDGPRQLLLLGAGTSDYLDGIWSPDAAPAAALALKHILQPDHRWDSASLHQLPPGSPLLQAATVTALTLSPAEPTSTLPVATSLPGKMRVNLNRYRRLAEAQGALVCRLAATPTEALTAFEHLITLHSRRWQGRGETGVLRDPRVLAHHRESLPLLLAAGLLRLFHLTLNGETLGVLYALADGPQAVDRRLYLYLIGFDARFAALSPGSLLVQEAWLHAREHGFTTLDFLRGGESYKRHWGAHPQPTHTLTPPGRTT